MTIAPVLKVRNIVKEFGAFKAVSGLTFDAGQNEIVGLLGPNGAGKTTTLRMLSGFISATQGDIWVMGHSMRERSLEARRQIGYLPENVPLYREMRVREFLNFVGGIRGLGRKELAADVNRLLDYLSLGLVQKKLIGTLSKGFRQRVGLAQAMIGSPKLILLDEPTSGLDPEQTVEIRSLIAHIKENSCVIMSTHLLSEVERIADRVLIMNDGAIVASGSPEDLNHRLAVGRSFRVGVRGNETKIIEVLESIPGVISVQKDIETNDSFYFRVQTKGDGEVQPKMAVKLIGDGIELLELTEEDVRLEEIFLKLVKS
ncbi:MAG: ABC transporter ATP-binding protein [Candidatus Omnitrophica bacterium]|nr:ABC transporter ATP-binding protein [Candidatus Omnitrophota bacterium]